MSDYTWATEWPDWAWEWAEASPGWLWLVCDTCHQPQLCRFPTRDRWSGALKGPSCIMTPGCKGRLTMLWQPTQGGGYELHPYKKQATLVKEETK